MNTFQAILFSQNHTKTGKRQFREITYILLKQKRSHNFHHINTIYTKLKTFQIDLLPVAWIDATLPLNGHRDPLEEITCLPSVPVVTKLYR